MTNYEWLCTRTYAETPKRAHNNDEFYPHAQKMTSNPIFSHWLQLFDMLQPTQKWVGYVFFTI